MRSDFLSKYRLEYLQVIEKLRLIDDIFMTACLHDNIPAVQLILRIILSDNALTVVSVKTQEELKNIYGHGVRLDVHAVDASGRHMNIEVQKDENGFSPERARYNSSLLDASILQSGQTYRQLAETYVIVIAQTDILKDNLPIYHINRIIEENGKHFNDGSYIIYVNAECQNETELGRLMQDFFRTNPETMHYKELAERAYSLKRTERGVNSMCEALEYIKDLGREEGRKEGHEEGRKEGRKEGVVLAGVNAMKNLMKNMAWSPQEALKALGIPDAEHAKYLAML